MDYSLAKALKDAGFPTNERGRWIVSNDDETLFIPSLSELIEACGNDLVGIVRTKNGWEARSFKDADGSLAHNSQALKTEGSTPEEAVARLWGALRA